MRLLRAHTTLATLLAFGVAGAAVAAIVAAYGSGGFAAAWSHLHPGWLVLSVCAELLTIPAYALSYQTLVRFREGPELAFALVLRVVMAGFGPFAPDGGFVLDKRALDALVDDERGATVRVLGLGALEWAVLAPIACITAVALLLAGDGRPMRSLLWPWALAVPIGFAIGLWLATPARTQRIAARGGRWRAVGPALEAISVLPSLARGFSRCSLAWIGTTLYWTLDIAAFYGAVRFIGLHPNLGEAILAYATGYALTRRAMPLGGAGVTEVLMTFALHWVGQPVLPALAAVVVYRTLNFVLPVVPAQRVRRRLTPLLRAADEGQTPRPSARRRAAAPIGQSQ